MVSWLFCFGICSGTVHHGRSTWRSKPAHLMVVGREKERHKEAGVPMSLSKAMIQLPSAKLHLTKGPLTPDGTTGWQSSLYHRGLWGHVRCKLEHTGDTFLFVWGPGRYNAFTLILAPSLLLLPHREWLGKNSNWKSVWHFGDDEVLLVPVAAANFMQLTIA